MSSPSAIPTAERFPNGPFTRYMVGEGMNLKEGDLVAITQGANTVQMPAMLESQLAAGCVRMSATTPASAVLGTMFGAVTVSRV